MYYEQTSVGKSGVPMDGQAMVIDLRSDTLSKPTKRMREAMRDAEVGDDVFCEDPTVKKLEQRAAELVGMEAALFVSSGTMGNLIAILNHCDERGSEAIVGENSHCILHEQCGAAQLGGVSLRTVRNNPDGTFNLDEVRSKLRKDRDHDPYSKLVCVENPTNGRVVPQEWLTKLVNFCKEHRLKLHMDGARLWNAVTASGISADNIVRGCDSVSFCLSKGLSAPVGSLLCGSKDFVLKARRVRKALGGGMRQVGVLAAAGLVALDEVIPLLKEDHRRALAFATAIADMKSNATKVDISGVESNMVFVTVDSNVSSSAKFANMLREGVNEHESDNTIVKALAVNDTVVRFVFCREITDEMLQAAIKKVRHVISTIDSTAIRE